MIKARLCMRKNAPGRKLFSLQSSLRYHSSLTTTTFSLSVVATGQRYPLALVQVYGICVTSSGDIRYDTQSYASRSIDKKSENGIGNTRRIYCNRKLHPLKPGTARTRLLLVVFAAFRCSTGIFRTQRLGQKRHDHHTGQARVCGYNFTTAGAVQKTVGFCREQPGIQHLL